MVRTAGGAGAGAGAGGGADTQAPRSSAARDDAPRRSFLECALGNEREPAVWLIIVEALLALGLLLFIVWWTMFHGRKPPKQ
jgi:hypothetical protein